MKKARDAVKSSIGPSYAIVPVFTDRPVEYDPESKSINVYHYTIGAAKISTDPYDLLENVYGSSQAQIKPVGDSTSSSPGHLRYALIAVNDGAGNIDVRNLTKKDEEIFRLEENKRIQKMNEERSAAFSKHQQELNEEINKNLKREEEIKKARTALDESIKKASDDAKKKLEDQKKIEDQEQQKIAKKNDELKKQKEKDEQARKESEAQIDLARRNRESVEKKAKERDSECAGGRTAKCAVLDDDLTNDFENMGKWQNTALCMIDAEGGAPLTGPCAPGAPPCIYCRPGAELDKQARIDSLIAAQVAVQAGLASKGIVDAKNLDKAVGKFLNSKAAKEKFGFSQLTIKKPK